MKADKKRITIVIIVLVIAVITISFLVFLIGQDKAKPVPTPTPKNSSSPIPSNVPTETIPDLPLEGLNEKLMEAKDPYTVVLDSSQVKLLDSTSGDNAFAIIYFPDKAIASFEDGKFLLNTKVFHSKKNYIGTVTIVADTHVKVGFLMADKDESVYMLDVQKNQTTADLSLMIINRNNPISKEQTESLKNLIQLTDPWYIRDNRKDLYTLAPTKQAMESMLKAANLQDESLNMHVASAYRSYTEQKQSFDYWVNKRVTQENMTYEQAYEYTAGRVAIPGCSEHHNGLTLDVVGDGYMLDESSKGAPYAKWLKDNSYKYGFHIRYEEGKEEHTLITLYEPWHLRYVGIPTAYYLYQNDLCMEEFYNMLVTKGYLDFEFENYMYRYIYTKSDNLYINSEIIQVEQLSVIATGIDGYVLLCKVH